MSKNAVLEFWNDRAKLQSQAGSNDVVAKTIEIEELARHFSDELDVMEFGCGNGITALEMARRFDVTVDAYDFAEEMVKEARAFAATTPFASRVHFDVGDITKPPKLDKRYDLVFTERMVINLPDWPAQLQAIRTLTSYLKIGGRLLLVENSATGLAEINKLRQAAGLSTIVKPWHNLYLDDAEVAAADVPGCRLEQVVPYSATYYFLSRVVNAWLAKLEGKEPSYDAAVNRLALELPAIGNHAQGKLWIWRRTA
jgi:SAM-dependent methyltransferase